LINDPAMLLLDEPMSGLDPIGRKEMRAVILDLKRVGKTIVMSTHLIHDVESLCDRVAILRRGTVAAVRSVQEMRGVLNDDGESSLLEELYCGTIQDGGV
jgi:ABC-2 type transport system ATP-binding protein